METVTILNQSGKVVSTGKHLVNIFKEAKDAYQEKKAEIRAEHRQRLEAKAAVKLLRNLELEDGRSTTSSRRSHRSRTSRHGKERSNKPPLTEHNLSHISEVSSVRSGGSHHGSERHRSSRRSRSQIKYQDPYFEVEDIAHAQIPRRNTDSVVPGRSSYNQIARRPVDGHLGYPPPPYGSLSAPDLHDNIDMDLAYGYLPPPLPSEVEKEIELKGLMTKLDHLMLEAQCVQHSATTIISSLQGNPEAMAAVALTLAEISNVLTKLGPGILATLKTSSPAIFALLISPQFLIAGGVAVGVTIVMFGGFKIIKKIQANAKAEREANRPVEAIPYEGSLELSSIENWRRGIALEEARSVATSVDGELITPEADKIVKRRKEERKSKSVRGDKSEVGEINEAIQSNLSGHTLVNEPSEVRREVPHRTSSRSVVSEKNSKNKSKSKGKEKEKTKDKKSSPLTVLFGKKGESSKSRDAASGIRSHRPKMIEM